MGNVPSVKKKTEARVKKVKYKSESSKNLTVEKKIYILLEGLKPQSLILFDPIMLYVGREKKKRRKQKSTSIQSPTERTKIESVPCPGTALSYHHGMAAAHREGGEQSVPGAAGPSTGSPIPVSKRSQMRTSPLGSPPALYPDLIVIFIGEGELLVRALRRAPLALCPHWEGAALPRP